MVLSGWQGRNIDDWFFDLFVNNGSNVSMRVLKNSARVHQRNFCVVQHKVRRTGRPPGRKEKQIGGQKQCAMDLPGLA
jgi:hypothetical protein